MERERLPDLCNSVIYQVFIDRFNGSFSGDWRKPDFYGGNIRGVIDRIAYFKELGVNGLWLTPFYETSAYHGYHITDFYKVDPRFGTVEDLKKLITTAHKNNIRIFADFVANHCSHRHPYFIEAQRDPNSCYRDWFYFTRWPDEYTCFLHFRELPKFNLTNPETYGYVVGAAKYWLSLGIDGFRLDHTAGPSHSFWDSFARDIRRTYPHAVLFGEPVIFGVGTDQLRETIHADKKWLAFLEDKILGTSEIIQRSYRAIFDGVLDFTFFRLLHSFIARPAWYKPRWLLRLFLNLHSRQYDNSFVPFLFLDNHDVERFLFRAGDDRERLKEAARLQFDMPFPKIIYQGTERGMSQRRSFSEIGDHGDLMAREPLDWSRYDKEVFEFYKSIIRRG